MADVHKPATPYVVYERISAFVGHSFLKKDRILVDAIKKILQALGVKCDSGEKPEGGSISKKILDRIGRNDIYVGVFTRRNKLADQKRWTTSSWVVEEKAAAIDRGKRLLLLVEEGVDEIGGLQGDYEYVKFSRGAFYESLSKIIDYVGSMTAPSRPIQIGVSSESAGLDIKSVLESLGSQVTDPEGYSSAAEKLQETRRFVDAEQVLRNGRARFPESQSLKYNLANVLRRNNKKDEAKLLYQELVELDPDSPPIHHNFAHLLEDLGHLDKALTHFQKALDIDPTSENFRCYGMCLYHTAMGIESIVVRTETLKKAKRLLENAVRLQPPEKADRRMEGFILNIGTCLDQERQERPTNGCT